MPASNMVTGSQDTIMNLSFSCVDGFETRTWTFRGGSGGPKRTKLNI